MASESRVPSTTRRTLHYYWLVTKRHKGYFFGLMAATFAFVALLTYGNPYVMSLVVDRVSADPVPADKVFEVFAPYIIALIAINVFGQAASKLQDYTMYKLEIAAAYDLATMSFDALCNQSMSFHSNRFGGTLVSQTSKFMSAYQQIIETITFPFLPVVCSVIFTCSILAPRVPAYVIILMILLAIYACVSYYMYKRILHLNEKAASAQNQLSGELSDSVANILSVKTYGREDYERGLFDQANREVVARDSKRMWASLLRGIITACITVVIMAVVTVFIAGGNAWYGITPGTLVVMFTYTYTITNQFNFINNGLQRFNRAFGDASGMTIILDEPRLVDDKPDAKPMVVTNGRIDFKDIGFSYTDGNTTTQVFKDFNLHIPAGQRVGLVGMSGAGKTTLTKLLLRLSDIQEGQILIDGQTQRSNFSPTDCVCSPRSVAFSSQYCRKHCVW
jgi:ATP-binding cassette subfamily B protein